MHNAVVLNLPAAFYSRIPWDQRMEKLILATNTVAIMSSLLLKSKNSFLDPVIGITHKLWWE